MKGSRQVLEELVHPSPHDLPAHMEPPADLGVGFAGTMPFQELSRFGAEVLQRYEQQAQLLLALDLPGGIGRVRQATNNAGNVRHQNMAACKATAAAQEVG
jgi:hypothetical protein